MKSPLKTLTSKQLAAFLPSYKGTVMDHFPKIPMYFSVK